MVAAAGGSEGKIKDWIVARQLKKKTCPLLPGLWDAMERERRKTPVGFFQPSVSGSTRELLFNEYKKPLFRVVSSPVC